MDFESSCNDENHMETGNNAQPCAACTYFLRKHGKSQCYDCGMDRNYLQ